MNSTEQEECVIIGNIEKKKESLLLNDITKEKTNNKTCGGFCKPLNLIGQKFGKLTVIEFAGIKKHRRVWKCQCDCGNVVDEILSYNLTRGNTTSCGCKFLLSKKYNFTDLTNKKFGRLTVLRKTNEYTKWRGVIWECQCDCGKIIKLTSNALTSENNTTCGDKNKHIHNGLTKEELRVGEIPLSHINQIKQNAIKRNLSFVVSNDYLWNLFVKQNRKCVLSGENLIFTSSSNASKNRKETTASLDRIDSSKGYVEGNVQWVHKDINMMKNKHTTKLFLKWCEKCYLYKVNPTNLLFNSNFDNYLPPDWNEWFMRGVYWAATKSKDKKTKIAAMIVKDKRIISVGFNGIPSGVNDNINERNERPLKYSFYAHGESNAVFNAAKNGISTNNSILYTNASPCSECCKTIIQSGINKVIIHKQYNDLCKSTYREQWKGHENITKTMFEEAGVELIEMDKILNVGAYLDGKIIRV